MSNTLHLFKNASDFKSLSAGECLFKAGTRGDLMYVVKEGEVDIKLGERVLETVRAGHIVGEMALIDGDHRSADAVCKTDCKLVPVDERRFNWMVQQTPGFALHVMRVLVDRTRRMNELIKGG